MLPLSAIALANKAMEDTADGASTRAALAALSVVGVQVSPEVAARVSLYNPATNTGQLTEEWITDRAVFTTLFYEQQQRGGGILPGTQNIAYIDKTSNTQWWALAVRSAFNTFLVAAPGLGAGRQRSSAQTAPWPSATPRSPRGRHLRRWLPLLPPAHGDAKRHAQHALGHRWLRDGLHFTIQIPRPTCGELSAEARGGRVKRAERLGQRRRAVVGKRNAGGIHQSKGAHADAKGLAGRRVNGGDVATPSSSNRAASLSHGTKKRLMQ